MSSLSRSLLISRSAAPVVATMSTKPRAHIDGHVPSPLQQLSEEESSIVGTVRRFAVNVIKPLVREMDDKSQMHQSVITGTFENGVYKINGFKHLLNSIFS